MLKVQVEGCRQGEFSGRKSFEYCPQGGFREVAVDQDIPGGVVGQSQYVVVQHGFATEGAAKPLAMLIADVHGQIFNRQGCRPQGYGKRPMLFVHGHGHGVGFTRFDAQLQRTHRQFGW